MCIDKAEISCETEFKLEAKITSVMKFIPKVVKNVCSF